jgi:hypothetical protein
VRQIEIFAPRPKPIRFVLPGGQDTRDKESRIALPPKTARWGSLDPAGPQQERKVMETKTVVFDGVTYIEEGPRCEFCGCHMGKLYNPKAKEGEKTFINPNNYNDFKRNRCRGCGMEYEYNEGMIPILSDEDKKLILKNRTGNDKILP